MIDPENPDYNDIPNGKNRPGLDYKAKNNDFSPAVTIITPFYNTGEVFHETAQSVFAQSLQQFEWIIINDGSTDPKSLEILDGYRKADPRVKIIDHDKNKGLAAARNTGFEAACAPYVFQLDSDDLIEPTTLEKCAWFLISHPFYGFTKGYTIGFGEKNYTDWKISFEHTKEFFRNNPVTATAMIRKKVHKAAGGYDESLKMGFEDWDFWLRCAEKGYWGATIWEHMDWYRTRKSHADRWMAFSRENREKLRKMLRNKYGHLEKKGFPVFDRYKEEPYGTLEEDIPFENYLHKEKKRLLIILPWFAVGGADKFNLDLVGLLTENHGYEITICASLTDEQAWLPRFKKYTSDIFILGHFLRNADHPRFINYLIKSRRIDALLITGSLLGYQLLPYIRAKNPFLTILNFEHIEQKEWRGGNYPRFSVNLRTCLDLSVVVSRYLKDWMVKRGANPKKTKVCYINIDTDYWKPSKERRKKIRQKFQQKFQQKFRQKFRQKDDTALILFTGRLVDQKRPKLLANIMKKLEKDGSDFLCLVAGNGPYEEWMKKFIYDNRLSNLGLMGYQPHDRIKDLLLAADIFFLPSDHEGIALSCYEAMAMALPIVCSDVGGQAELITPDCGILIKKDENELDNYVEALKKLVSDKNLRKNMGNAARNRVESKFRLENMGKRMANLIEKAKILRKESPEPVICPVLAKSYCMEMLEQNRLRACEAYMARELEKAKNELEKATSRGIIIHRNTEKLEAEIRLVKSSRLYKVMVLIWNLKKKLMGKS